MHLGGIFEELKRRNVFRVGVAYAVVGWLAVQVVHNFFPALNLPEWTHTFVAILILIGFPFALLFAWAYELTPEGLRRSHEVDPGTSIVPSIGRKLDYMIIGALVLGLSYFVWVSRFADAPGSGANRMAEVSIAVLPFVNLSSDPEQEYFSDGISEELLNVLAQIPDLRVAARTSSFRFKGEARDIQDIARQLNVALIVEGSVRRGGATVRITAQLIDANTGFHLWSATYDRELDDIFAVQDEISAAIVGALVEILGLSVQAAPQIIAAANPQAYDSYLLGVHQMEKRGAATLVEAAAHFERALEIDPDYAPAHARLGMTYLLLGEYDMQNYPKVEIYPKALPHVERALELAVDLPESQAAMGSYLMETNVLLQAEPYLKRAIELNPSYATVYTWLAILYAGLGRYEEQMVLLEQAVRIDPLSTPGVTSLIFAYMFRNMPEKAAPLMARMRQLSPLSYQRLSMFQAGREGREADLALHALQGLAIDRNFNSARAVFKFHLAKAFRLYQENIEFGFFPVGGHYGLGNTDELLALARDMERLWPDSTILAYSGYIYWVTGNLEKARELVERALQSIADRPARAAGLGPLGVTSLIALRQDTGDQVGAAALTDQVWDNISRRKAAGIIDAELDWQAGLLHLNAGRDDEGMQALQRAIDGHFVPNYVDLFHLTRYPHLDFEPMLARFRAKMDIERDKFLTIVCNGGNPAPEAWTPLPETCEGF